ncbi:MAG: hypothetical protein ACJ719_09175 [Nitrososphaeraceae archaeon]
MRKGLPLGTSIYIESNICLDGFTVREERTIQYHNQNGFSCLCQNKRKENEETKFLRRDKAMGS